MAHYAYLDANNIVTHIIVGKNENEFPGDWEHYYGAKRTSYNTRGGVYYDPNTNNPSIDQSKAYRKNYAVIGGLYDFELDAFISPRPYLSWNLNINTCLWEPPFSYPNDGKKYFWDEALQTWIPVD